MCCSSGLIFCGMKLSWMAADSQKPQKFYPTNVKVHMVVTTRLSMTFLCPRYEGAKGRVQQTLYIIEGSLRVVTIAYP